MSVLSQAFLKCQFLQQQGCAFCEQERARWLLWIMFLLLRVWAGEGRLRLSKARKSAVK